MADLFNLLTQSQPIIATGKALLIVDVQNDFILSNGKLKIPNADEYFVNTIENIAATFRGQGDVVWVRSVFKSGRTVNDASGNGDRVVVDAPRGSNKNNSRTATPRQEDPDTDRGSSPLSPTASRMLQRPSGARILSALQRAKANNELDDQEGILPHRVNAQPEVLHDTDSELFLSEMDARRTGDIEFDRSNFVDRVRDTSQGSKDIRIVKSHYSAFNETALLLTLRAKFITELYICGCFANLSIYATVVDAVRHGFDIHLVEDCMVSRSQSRHDEAKRQMVDLMGATTVLSQSLVNNSTEAQGLDGKGTASGIKNEPKADFKDESVNIEEVQGLMQKIELGERNDDDVKLYHEHKEINPNMAAIPHDKDKEQERQRKLTDSTLPDNRSEYDRSSGISTARTNKQSLSVTDSRREIQSEVIGKAESYTRATNDQKQSIKTKPITSEFETGSLELEQPVVLDSTGVSDNSRINNVEELPKSNTDVDLGTDRKNISISLAHSTSQISDKVANSTQKANMSGQVIDESSNEKLGEGDSSILFDLIPSIIRDPAEPTKSLSDTAFSRLYQEVQWQKMYHVQGEVPRLVAVQGEICEDGSMPIYRHPSDQSPPLLHFSPTVQLIRDILQKKIDQPVNHVLIQLYRSGNDYISEHSDKTLDIVRGSSILNVSFGAQRTMKLRTKKLLREKQAEETIQDRKTQRVPMPHNSMFFLGEKTNASWLHSITQDRRAPRYRAEPEKAYEGSRISLTFRHVGTFLDSGGEHIWGQGATSKSYESRSRVVNGNESLAQEMIYAFGTENRSSIFDWKATYGAGFDVLHFYTNPPHLPLLFLSGNLLDDLAILTCLKELKLSFEPIDPPTMTATSMSSTSSSEQSSSRLSESMFAQDHVPVRNVCYRDNDVHHTEVVGAQTILLYLDRYHHLDEVVSSFDKDTVAPSSSRSCTARAYAYLSTPITHSKEPSDIKASLLLPSSTFFEIKKKDNKEEEEEKEKEKEDKEEQGKEEEGVKGARTQEILKNFLHSWECELNDGRPFAAGSSFTIADCLLWPRVHYLLHQRERSMKSKEDGGESYSRVKEYPLLKAYNDRLTERAPIRGLMKKEVAPAIPVTTPAKTVAAAVAVTGAESSAS